MVAAHEGIVRDALGLLTNGIGADQHLEFAEHAAIRQSLEANSMRGSFVPLPFGRDFGRSPSTLRSDATTVVTHALPARGGPSGSPA